jgi:protein-disulfide isomerase
MPPKQRPNRVEVPGGKRGPNTRLLLGLIAAAAVVTAGAIALSLTLGGGHKSTPPTTVAGDLGILDGIPQHGSVLGDPKAKITLTEYIDTSCPICKDYVLATFPAIVKRYVRTGKMKIESRVLAFVGPSSTRGRQLLLAAARQDKAWQFADLLYHNQGDETTAWLTDDYARALAAKIPGLNVDTLFADASSAAVQAQATTADSQAQADSVAGTPTFVLTTKDGGRHLLGSGNPGVAPMVKALDHALAG